VHLKITERWPDNMVTDMFQIWHHNGNPTTEQEKEEIQQKRERGNLSSLLACMSPMKQNMMHRFY
jgi:hypothetical protein